MIAMERLIEIVAATELVEDMSRFDPAMTFKENDIDSLDVMTLLLAIEEEAGRKFSEDEVGKIHSLNDVFSIIQERS